MGYAVEITIATPITRESSASANLARLISGKAQYEQAVEIASKLVAAGWQLFPVDELQTDGNQVITYRCIKNDKEAEQEAKEALPSSPIIAIKQGAVDSAGQWA